jgi:hypothetical protein
VFTSSFATSSDRKQDFRISRVAQLRALPLGKARHPQMVGTRAQKQAAVEHQYSPLDDSPILEMVLRFVGGGEGLFLRGVNAEWKTLYDKLPTRRRLKIILRQTPSSHTAFRAAFASASRLRLAHECGLQLDREDHLHRLQTAAGRYADIKTLMAAHALGLDFNKYVLRGAARGNRLASLKWLCRHQKCPLP